MRWRGNRKSSNVEDRRGMRAPTGSRLSGAGGGSMLRLLPVVFKLLGFKGTAILAILVAGYALFSGNLGNLLGGMGAAPQVSDSSSSAPLHETAEEKERVEFVSVILADTEQTWQTLFDQKGISYREPRLVLFRDAVSSACGLGQAAMGPFYCPGDQRVYIDLGFYDQLKDRFKAPGDFAQAYVIAHEVGHHVQTLLGTSQKVHAAQQKLSQVEANKLSVLLELQADCLAGVWAHHADHSRQLLESGDIEEGLTAASAIGDDTLQKQSSGHVRPDTFTHGSSAQRVAWFKTGLAAGSIDSCDTFGTTARRLPLNTASSDPAATIAAAFAGQRSDVQVRGDGLVSRLLRDDTDGSRHQKFILRLADGIQVLVAHNIDLAPRIPDLRVGDRIEFFGEYEWNDKGGVLHWTHKDPAGRHPDGWLRHSGRTYQ